MKGSGRAPRLAATLRGRAGPCTDALGSRRSPNSALPRHRCSTDPDSIQASRQEVRSTSAGETSESFLVRPHQS
jgi:hypothetical protein